MRRMFLPLLCCLALLGGVAAVGFSRAFVLGSRATVEREQRLRAQLPRLVESNGFASSNRCQSCHPAEHATWHQSFHRSMTQPATPAEVVGRFDGTTIDSAGLEYRLYREGDEFWAEMPDPDQIMFAVQGGKRIDATTYLVKRARELPIERLDLRQIPRVRRQVVMTTGSHHYQTYWVKGDAKFGNLLQTLPLIYLIADDLWIPREQAFMYPPDSMRLVTQWNHHCIRCHSTGGVPGLDPQRGTFDTRVAELGIACEACHGPGEEHIRANRDPRRRYELHLAGQSDPTIVNPGKLDHRASSQVCGQCHGVYIMRNEYAMKYAFEGVLYRPGEDLFKTRYYIQHPANESEQRRQQDMQQNPEFFRERWWPDGTVLAGGREFTALSVSGCYTRGEISCLNCHTMHGDNPVDQLRPELSDQQNCTQCHGEAKYTTQIAEHTFHAEHSSGSNCLNCHMPHTTYALLGAIRNHGIDRPSVVGSAEHGVPNACNLCHLDQTLDWTQEHLVKWYGAKPVALSDEQRTTSAALLWLLKGDAAQRIITVWHLGWPAAQAASGDDWQAPFAAQLLNDPYGVVRYVAFDALRKLPGFATAEYNFLADPEARPATVARFVTEWTRQSRAPRRAPGSAIAILLTDRGELDAARLESMLKQRNDRPVVIKE